jgi:hypothetical protein
MADLTNYGCLLYVQSASGSSASGVSVAGMTRLEPPSVKAPTQDARNHSTGLYPNKISKGIVEIDSFNGQFSFDPDQTTQFYTSMISGSAMDLKITFPNEQSWYFSALVSEFSPQGADAQSPDLLSVRVGFDPTGTMIIV